MHTITTSCKTAYHIITIFRHKNHHPPINREPPALHKNPDKLHGEITSFGIEGTGSYGKNLTAYLQTHGYTVIEVNRGNRQTRRQSGKTDTIDAITAARTVLSGQATTTPKNHEGNVEMMRQSQIVRDHAVKNMTEIMNILHDMLLSAPEEICQSLTGKTPLHIATTCSTLHKDTGHALTDNVICNLIRLSTRWLSLHSLVEPP